MFTTTSKKADALKIANALIDARLAACVQIVGPIKSIYMWKRKKEESEEWLCIAKSKIALYKKVQRLITKLHPYELPEITYVEISGNQRYLKWIDSEIIT